MNTENLIPISYVKQFTPLVKGDEVKWYRNGTWVNATVKNEKVNTIYPGQLHTNKGIFSDVELSEYGVFVVSFANRPNTTGTQPVDDDVVVDMSKTLGGPRAASELRWARIGIIPTWKPNHEAMLAKFKEQGANTMNEQEHKAKSHEVALMTNALDDNPDEQVIEPWVVDHITDKPVFTQEVELLIGGGKNVPEVYKAGRFVYHGSKYSIFVTGDGKEYSRKNSKIKTRPIDNRSDKDKVVDALRELLESLNIDSAQVSEALTDLMSDKFTIALNK